VLTTWTGAGGGRGEEALVASRIRLLAPARRQGRRRGRAFPGSISSEIGRIAEILRRSPGTRASSFTA
jgi:hypothetical protein